MRAIIASVVVAFGIISCNFSYSVEKDENGSTYRETTESGDGKELEIKMSGTVSFSEDGKTITGISKGGYVSYENGDVTIDMERGEGENIDITITENGETISANSDKGKKLLEESAVRISKLQNGK